MNWIRDNILKLVILLVVIIVVIVVVALFAKKDTVQVETGTGYEQLENKLIEASKNFARENRSILPTTLDKKTTIKLNTLIEKKYIGEIHAVDNDNVVCTGSVDVTLLEEGTSRYRFLPHLKCGNYYETSTIADYIERQVVTSGDGLYKDGEGYVFKGDYPNNHIMIGDVRYRILSITADGNLKLLSTRATKSRYIWDNRYNSEIGKSDGINTYSISRMKDNLQFLYSNTDEKEGEVFFTDKERDYMIDYPFCVAKIDVKNNKMIDSKSECNETSIQKVGLMGVSDFYKASIATGCTGIDKYECNNYNYLFGKGTFVTMNAYALDSSKYLVINNGRVTTSTATDGSNLHLVIYISGDNIFKSGAGTKKDPYVIR